MRLTILAVIVAVAAVVLLITSSSSSSRKRSGLSLRGGQEEKILFLWNEAKGIKPTNLPTDEQVEKLMKHFTKVAAIANSAAAVNNEENMVKQWKVIEKKFGEEKVERWLRVYFDGGDTHYGPINKILEKYKIVGVTLDSEDPGTGEGVDYKKAIEWMETKKNSGYKIAYAGSYALGTYRVPKDSVAQHDPWDYAFSEFYSTNEFQVQNAYDKDKKDHLIPSMFWESVAYNFMPEGKKGKKGETKGRCCLEYEDKKPCDFAKCYTPCKSCPSPSKKCGHCKPYVSKEGQLKYRNAPSDYGVPGLCMQHCTDGTSTNWDTIIKALDKRPDDFWYKHLFIYFGFFQS